MNNRFDLSGKNAIITGGGSGIGEAIAHALAQAGAFVNIMEINEANGLKVVEAITEKPFKNSKYFVGK